ncbi:MAG: 4Fe-4S dicluster domain-containing protein [Bacteroidales bacterium]
MGNKPKAIQELQRQTGVNVSHCYQCGKCTAGCELADEMDYPPSLLMHMLQRGDESLMQQLLHSKTIWLCVSCQNCVTRCPMQIDIPQIMDYLREKSVRENKINPESRDIVAFHRAFLDSVKFTGRLYEIGLIAGYKMRTFHLIQDVAMAPKMYSRGKLPLMPELVKNRKHLSSIFFKTKNPKD